jgi:hypothetical protein
MLAPRKIEEAEGAAPVEEEDSVPVKAEVEYICYIQKLTCTGLGLSIDC